MVSTIVNIVAALGLFAASIDAQKIPSSQCHKPGGVHAILARGESLPGDVDPSVLNVLVNTRDAIVNNIPGSTVVGLQYQFTNPIKNYAVMDGANQFKNYVADYVASCGPNSNIALLGYSMGAMAMMDSLCGTSSPGLIPVVPMDPKYNANVIAAFTFGDETHAPFQPWAKGTCPNGLGLFPRVNNFGCNAYASALHTYCDQKDDQCCAWSGNNGNVGHFGYGDRYNSDIVSFIKGKLSGRP